MREEAPAVHLFGLQNARVPVEQASLLARALRRAVMARIQSQLGRGETLSPFFTGHLPDGAPASNPRGSALAEIAAIAGAVRQFGGYVWAATEFGRGTIFRIFLPQIAN